MIVRVVAGNVWIFAIYVLGHWPETVNMLLNIVNYVPKSAPGVRNNAQPMITNTASSARNPAVSALKPAGKWL